MRAHARLCVCMCVGALVPAHVCVRQLCASLLCASLLCASPCLHMHVCATHQTYFRQTPETPEPLNKYIFYDNQYHAGGQKSLFTRGEYGRVRYLKCILVSIVLQVTHSWL